VCRLPGGKNLNFFDFSIDLRLDRLIMRKMPRLRASHKQVFQRGYTMFRASLLAGFGVIGLALLIADQGFSQQDKTEPAPGVKGQLPKYWSKIGLSDEQKQKVYATEASFRTKIEG
jgi:hypothetical protein